MLDVLVIADNAERKIYEDVTFTEVDGTQVFAGRTYDSFEGWAYNAVYDAYGGAMTQEGHDTSTQVAKELARRGVIKPDNRKHYGDKIDWAWRISRRWWNQRKASVC